MSRLIILLALAVSAQSGTLIVKVPADPAQCLALTTSSNIAYAREVESRGQKYIVTFSGGKIDVEPMGNPPKGVDWHKVFFLVILGAMSAMAYLIATWPRRRR